MKTVFTITVCLSLTFTVFAQNLATVTATNISDVGGNKLASGQLCFLATDQNDNPISFQVGGGGQIIRRPFCSTVTAGVASTFNGPNPATTSPSGILLSRYRKRFHHGAGSPALSGSDILRRSFWF